MSDYTLSVKMKGDASDLDKKLAGVRAKLDGVGSGFKSAGGKISSVGKSLTNKITKPAMVATGALVGVTLVKGFNRLVGIDSAKAKLKALGHSAESVEAIMDSALDSVKGTSYGLDEAATSAATAVAAGVKPGQDLTKYLTMVGDAAAIAGTSMGDMGSILGKVQTAQRAYTQEINQLADAGLPVYQWLADEMNTTTDGVRELAKEGEISSETFFNAINKNIGGAAKIIGETSFTGALSNVWAAVGRLGASFLDAGGKAGGFFEQVKPLMVSLTEGLDSLGPKAESLGAKFGSAFTVAVDKVKGLVDKFNELRSTDEGSAKLKKLGIVIGGLAAAGPVLTVVGKGMSFIGGAINGISGAIGVIQKIGMVLSMLGAPALIVIGVIAALSAAFAYLMATSEGFREQVSYVVASLAESLMPIITSIGNLIRNIVTALAPLVLTIMESIMALIVAIMPTIKAILPVVASVIDGIISVITPIIEIVSTILSTVIKVVTTVLKPIITIVGGIISSVVGIVGGLIRVFSTIFGGILKVVSSVFKVIGGVISGVFTGIQKSWKGLTGFVSGIVDGISGAFDSLVQGVKDAVNFVTSGINKAIGIINKIPNVSISKIPKLAQGTDNWSGGFAIMNEAGRGELVNLPNGSQVIPHDISVKYAKESARLNNSSGGNGFDTDGIAGAIIGLGGDLGRAAKEALNGSTVILDGREGQRAIGRLVTR